ncbi:MAG: cation diffusion facilitator family transporter [Candidatus Methanomethylophilus sp.]|nr:cation diffusion facilitator family transporter [Methanomethylophilus sp.]MDD3232900.1 cation diffusion facilitator family transporter [Methanomethylophilus sp.]MDD4221827.1 cation diffusion facilitator family transporter [Methanomethylophilus sp.]MDD4668501.1 cation diffusion facilitator family transporter [Methanomethylophilus sp.]
MGNAPRTPAQENFDYQKVIAVVGLVLMALKFFAYFLTSSVAILTDALESIVNVVAGGIGLYALYLSARPADRTHPYGHGKVELISSSVEGTLIGVAGILIIFESVDRILHPAGIRQLDIGIIIVAFAALVNFLVGYRAIRKGRKNHSLALEASGKHLCTDTMSSIGIIIGLTAVVAGGYLGYDVEWLDPVMALLFGALIIITGARVLWKSLNGIMDHADDQLLREVLRSLNHNRTDVVIDIHHLRAVRYGMSLHLDIHMTVPRELSVSEAAGLIDWLTAGIRKQFGDEVDITFMADPCNADSCPFCSKDDCGFRAAQFRHRAVLSVDNAVLPEPLSAAEEDGPAE